MRYYLDGVIKSVGDGGGFTAIASMPTLDRDKEVVAKGAFLPLPRDVPVLFHHRYDDPVGRCVPRYDGDALLVDGVFSSSARGQEVRGMVADGTLAAVSVGFMDATREVIRGVTTITSGELLEVSLVSVPSNREAAVLSVRGFQPGARLTEGDRWRLRLAALQAELLLLDTEEAIKAPQRQVADPVDVHGALADAKAFLAELAAPARPAKPEVKAAPPQSHRTLFDMWNNQREDR